MGVALRPAGDDDEAFLHEVFASTRQRELEALAADQRAAFVRMQYVAQDGQYRQAYPDAAFDVVLVDGMPVGRLSVARRPDEIRIVDIALLPGHRGRGIGTALLEAVLAEGTARSQPVTLHVDSRNQACRLYHRLGFSAVSERGGTLFLERQPRDAGPAVS